MARSSSRRIENLACLLLVLSAELASSAFLQNDAFAPEFNSIEQVSRADDEDYKRVTFEVRGRNIQHGVQVKATKTKSERNSECQNLNVNYTIGEISTSEFQTARYELTVPKSVQGDVYLCLPRRIKEENGLVPPSIFGSEFFKWYHQGPDIRLNLTSDHEEKTGELSLKRRNLAGSYDNNTLRVMGIRLEASDGEPDFDENGVPVLMANKEHTIRLFGEGFTPNMTITFTSDSGSYNDHCDMIAVRGFPISTDNFVNHTVVLKIKLPPIPSNAETFYICVKESNSTPLFIHQGSEYWLQIKTFEKILPLWAAICIIFICLSFSALFSGLNLGLMSMDKTDLKILCNTGTPRERKYARAIQPVRATGNYLLCSILLGNVFVNSIFTILLDDLTSGLIAVIFSTIAIVMFGEITPQAVCSRHGLAIGAKTIWITKFVMVLTFPLSYPIAKFLDCLLGEEIGNVYTRERLKELVRVTTGENDLDKDEVNIISGALELRKKTVSEVMTKIEDVFMLDYEAILDFETVSEIMKSGYSRIPVYESNRQNIVTVLYIKDLAFVDPDDNTPLKTLCQFYQNPCNFVFEDVTLDVMFKIFKEGNKGHMAFVHRVNNEGEGDPFYETIGLITLEDVIEELIQAEIMDETDVFTDNRTKRRRIAERRQDFSMFAEKRGEPCKVRISPQLTLAAFQYLSTSVEPFQPNVISETILRRLLKQDIVVHIKKNKDWRTDPANVIYQQGKAVDFFVIILEGRVEVTVGKENLVFEGGPFTYFGTQALVQTVGIESPSVAPSAIGSLESLNIDSILRHTFIPDYTVRACTEVLYLRIKRSLYLAAKRATLMERSKRGEEHQSEQQFDEEVDKFLHSLQDDEASTGARTPSRKPSGARPQEGKEKLLPPTGQKSPRIIGSSPTLRSNGRHSNGSVVSSQLLHSLEEDDVSAGAHTPGRKSSRTRSHGEPKDSLSAQTSPKYASASPPHRLTPRDINGSIKSSPVDEIQIGPKDEEVSLLPKRS